MMHQVQAKLSAGGPIGHISGPWWFIQLWFNLHCYSAMGLNLMSSRFPTDYTKEEEITSRRCMSFGEATSAIPSDKPSAARMTEFFQVFYNGFTKEKTICYAYEAKDSFEHPMFNFWRCRQMKLMRKSSSQSLHQQFCLSAFLQVEKKLGPSNSIILLSQLDSLDLAKCQQISSTPIWSRQEELLTVHSLMINYRLWLKDRPSLI